MTTEDYEPEDQEHKVETITSTYSKSLDFDMVREVRPAINRIKPPNFGNMYEAQLADFESKTLFGKAFIDRTTQENVILKHHKTYYMCAHPKYYRPMPTLNNPIPSVHSCELEINPIQTGEEIVVVTFYLSKYLGTTYNERWRKDCWLWLEPSLRLAWSQETEAVKKAEIQEYFDLHSVLDEHGNRVPEPGVKPGRPSTADQYDLTPEDATQRRRLLTSHSSSIQHLKKVGREYDGTMKSVIRLELVKSRLNDLYDAMERLGGVPAGWEKYKLVEN